MVARCDGAQRRLSAEHDGRMSLAWHTAALSRQAKLPDLASLLTQEKTTPHQTPAEQEIMIDRLFLAWGGDPEKLDQMREKEV